MFIILNTTPKKKKVEYIVTENGCHEVISHSCNKDGYPIIKDDYKKKTIHRLVYQEHFGRIDEDLVIRHKCDNRLCINPEHLEIGTHSENVMDRDIRHRTAIGNRNGRSKLDEDKIRYIRNSNLSQAKLGEMFGVDKKTIRCIKKNLTWKHVK